MHLCDGILWAFGYATPTAMALCGDDLGCLVAFDHNRPIGTGSDAQSTSATFGGGRTAIRPNDCNDRFNFPFFRVKDAAGTGGRGRTLGNTAGDIFWPLAGAGKENAIGWAVDWAQFGMVFHKPSARTLDNIQHRTHVILIWLGNGCLVEHDHVIFFFDHAPETDILRMDKQVVRFFILCDQAWTSLDEVNAHLPGPVVELFVSF